MERFKNVCAKLNYDHQSKVVRGEPASRVSNSVVLVDSEHVEVANDGKVITVSDQIQESIFSSAAKSTVLQVAIKATKKLLTMGIWDNGSFWDRRVFDDLML